MKTIIFKSLSIIGYIVMLIFMTPIWTVWRVFNTPFTTTTVQDEVRWVARDILKITRSLMGFLKSKLKEGANPKLTIQNCIDAFFISLD